MANRIKRCEPLPRGFPLGAAGFPLGAAVGTAIAGVILVVQVVGSGILLLHVLQMRSMQGYDIIS